MSETNIIAPIPLGREGLWGSDNISQIPPGGLLSAVNIVFEGSTIRKSPGTSKFNTTAISGNPGIIGITEFFPDGDTQRIVVACNDGTLRMQDDNNLFTTTLGTGLTNKDHVSFAVGGGESLTQNTKLFFFNGVNSPRVLSGTGTAVTNISNPNTDWAAPNNPSFGFVHRDRLFAGGNLNDANRLYYSATSDHEDFRAASGGGSFSIFPGDGGKLIAGLSFAKSIILFKYPSGVYIIDASDVLISNWVVFRLNDKLGLASPSCVRQVNNDVIYVTATGDMRSVSTTDTFSNFNSQSIIDGPELRSFIRNNVSFSGHRKWILDYNPETKEIIWFLTGVGSGVNNAALSVNISRQPFRFSWLEGDKPLSSATFRYQDRQRLHFGDASGFVWRTGEENRNKGGIGYASEFQISPTDFSYLDLKLSTIRKSGKFLEIEFDSKGGWTVDVDVYWDDALAQTLTFIAGYSSSQLGNIILGKSLLGGRSVLNTKHRMVGGGRRLSLVLRNSTADQDFSVSRIFVHMTLEDQKII